MNSQDLATRIALLIQSLNAYEVIEIKKNPENLKEVTVHVKSNKKESFLLDTEL